MGWSFRKSIRLGKGVRINLSRRGIGWSIGSKLLRFGVSGGRSRVSSGVGPFRYQKTLSNEPSGGGGCGCLSLVVIVLAVGVVIGAMQSGSRSSRSETKTNAPRSTPGPLLTPQPTTNRQIAPPASITNTAPTIPQPAVSVRPLPTGPAAEAAKQRAIARYPQLAVAGSALNRAFVERVQRYQRERPSVFDDPEWPTTIARECVVPSNP